MRLSKNWWLKEFRCKGVGCCGGSAVIIPQQVELLQYVRDLCGQPLYVVHESNPAAGSGFRCVTHNSMIRGAKKDSDHLRGMAADVWGIDATIIYENALKAIEALGFGYAILYEDRNFVHIGIRSESCYGKLLQ